jgi:toxin ParE1/3/4
LAQREWRVQLSVQAQRDVADIVRWTAEQFGRRQTIVYHATLYAAIESLAVGPDVPGSTAREELGPGRRTLHVARGGRRGRHVLVYRAIDERTIRVSRILHDSMDIGRHVPQGDD